MHSNSSLSLSSLILAPFNSKQILNKISASSLLILARMSFLGNCVISEKTTLPPSALVSLHVMGILQG